MNQILEQLGTYGIVPVVVLQDAAKAEPLAKALCKGGLACAEVTFRTCLLYTSPSPRDCS